MREGMKTLYMSAALAIIAGCGNQNDSSSLKRNGSPNDETVKIVRIANENSVDFVLVSKDKGYKLSCNNPLKFVDLLAATGYPSNLLNSTPYYNSGSPEATNLKVKEQPEISCEPSGKVLFKSDLDGKTKYFFSDSKMTSTRLYMLGCQGLVNAMGFKLPDARPIEPAFIDDLGIFSVNDEDDLNCLSGVSVGAKMKWIQGEDIAKVVSPGYELDYITYEAQRPDGTSASLSTKIEGTCAWIKKISVSSALILTGKVPENYYNSECKVTVEADAGTFSASKKTLVFSTNPIQPKISSTCKPTNDIVKLSDLRTCTVTSDLGEVEMKVPEVECEKVWNFDRVTGNLKIAFIPLAGKSCVAEFVADLNGEVSESLQISVNTICELGFHPAENGSCERVACDDLHKFGDSWTEANSDLNGHLRFNCSAEGKPENQGLDSCFEGYGLKSSQCLLKCDKGLLDGESSKVDITNGFTDYICKSGSLSSYITCNSGSILKDDQCLQTCDGVLTDKKTSYEPVTGGNIVYTCNLPTLSRELVCSSGHVKRDDTCKVSCDNAHADGEFWPGSSPANGTVTNSCSGSTLVSSLVCGAGYTKNGNSCQKNEPARTDTPCGSHAHNSTWTDYECGAGGEYKKVYSCNNGSKKLVSSTKLGTMCR